MANNGGIEVARAFVTITPSMEGAQKEMTSELVPAAEAAGEEAGKKAGSKISSAIGSVLKASAKVIGAGLTAAAGAATAAIGTAVKEAKELAEVGDRIDKESQKLGISAQAYQEWDAIMQHTGGSVDNLKPALKTLSKEIINNSDAFKQLGIAQEDIINQPIEDVLATTITKLQEMPPGVERTRLATQLLGKSSVELGALLNTSAEETEAMRQRVHELGGVMSNEAVKEAAAFQDNLQDLKTALNGMKRSIISQAIPSLNKLMAGFTGVIIGEEGAAEALKEGAHDFLVTVKDMLVQGLSIVDELVPTFIDVIIESLPDVINLGAQIIQTLLDAIIKALPMLLKMLPQAISLVLNLVTQTIRALVNALPDVIGTIVDALPTMIPVIIDAVVDIILAIVDKIDDIIKPIIKALPVIIKSLVSALIKAAPQLIQGITTLVTELIKMLPKVLPELIQLGFDIFFMIVENIDQIIGPLLDALPEILTTIFDAIIELIPKLIELLVENVPKFIKGLIKVQVAIIQKLPEVLQKIWEAITKFFSTVWDEWIGPAVKKVGEFFGTICETFTGIWDGIKKTAIEIVKWFLHTIAEPIALAFATAWDSISYGAKVLWWGVKTVFATGINTIIDLLNGAIDFINTIGRSVANVLGTTYEEIKPIGKIVTESFDEIGENSHEAANSVKQSFSGLDQWLDEKVAEPSKEAFKNAFSSKTGIGKTINDSTNAWKTALGTVAEKAKKMPEDVSAPANSSLNDLLKKTKQTMNDISAATGKKIPHPTVEKPHFTVSPKGWKYADLLKGVVPKFGIEWYAKAMEKGMILNGATIFGAIGNKLLGGGEAGSETVVGTNSLMNMIENAVNKASGAINRLSSLQGTRAVNSNQNITINVYGAEGQSVDALADEVIDRLQNQIYTQEAIFA